MRLDKLRDKELIEDARNALKQAEETGSLVEILQAKQSLGIALLNAGQIAQAESQFADIIKRTLDERDDRDLKQVLGATMVVRANILLGKSLYNQALQIGLEALGILSGTEDYKGLRAACSAVSRAYRSLGDEDNADTYQKRVEDYERKMKSE